jgi:hypothetical protein
MHEMAGKCMKWRFIELVALMKSQTSADLTLAPLRFEYVMNNLRKSSSFCFTDPPMFKGQNAVLLLLRSMQP